MAHTGYYGDGCCLKHLQVGGGADPWSSATMWTHLNMQEGADTPRAVLRLIWREIVEGLSTVFTSFLPLELRYLTTISFISLMAGP